MSPVEVAERLAGGGLLGEGPGPVARHRSLAAAVDWSFRLLPDPEQELFARLSVFAGGCDARAAHRVCLPDTDEDPPSTCSPARRPVAGRRPARGATARATGCWRRCARTAGARSAAISTRWPGRTPGTTPSWPRKPPSRCGAPPNRRGWNGCSPTTTTCAPRSSGPSPTATPTWRCGWRRRWASSRTCASATSPRRGRSGRWRSPDRSTRCGPPRSARRRAARGTAPSSPAPGIGRARRGPRPPPVHLAHLLPGDVLADVQLYEGDVDPALAYSRRRVAPGHRPHPAGVDALLRRHLPRGEAGARGRGRGRQGEPAVAEATANPTARSMARYALGLVLKKTEPDRRSRCSRRRRELAAAVRNFWWHGIALMEAAATRGVHGDPHAAVRAVPRRPRPLGPRRRLDPAVAQPALHHPAAGPARRRRRRAVLHHCLLAAGKPSPLRDVGAVDVPGAPMSGADAVARARTALTRTHRLNVCNRLQSPGATILRRRASGPHDLEEDPAMTSTIDTADRELKARHRAMWGRIGDYPYIAIDLIAELGPRLVDAVASAAASGCSTSPRAPATPRCRRRSRGAEVIASDLAPELFEAGRAFAARHGVDPRVGGGRRGEPALRRRRPSTSCSPASA